MDKLLIQTTEPQPDYELIDSGEGEKIERFGEFIVRRPDPQALWTKALSDSEWKKADAAFERSGTTGKWRKGPNLPEWWKMELGGMTFRIEPSPFKHTGLFPEQLSNWGWIRGKVASAGRTVRVLNLFGYTGGATLSAASAGAEVVHVDASKGTIRTARENADLSGLSEKPVRWILDDAHAFVARELRRKNFYDAIVMDPPTFGRGARGESWKIEDDLVLLLINARKLLSPEPLFVLLNGYASGYSAVAYGNALAGMMEGVAGGIEFGELSIRESKAGRLLPAGIFARWSK